jgi:cell division protease FtsH
MARPLPPPSGDGAEPPPPPGMAHAVLFAVAAAVLFALFYSAVTPPRPAAEAVSWTEFNRRLAAGDFARVEIDGTELHGLPPEGAERPAARTHAPAFGAPDLLARLEAAEVEVTARPPSGDGWWSWAPLLLILVIWAVVLGRMRGGMDGRLPGGPEDFLSGFWKRRKPERPDVTFADVAGQDAAKQEVAELIEFLREPERFFRVGATAPRGVLLMGPPGTGKTLMARALAGEAGVPFFSTSASEFIELYVGVGAARVRRMFEEARKQAPSVVFIDELDSIGRVRGAGLGGGHDEREQTLNQILAELDGFSGREGVVVLAATNRPDVLDPALLRPGRFDRHVTLNLPDKAGRRAILDVHVARTPLDPDVDLDAVAAGCPGFSGADLRNLVNEAAIFAARERLAAVPMRCFEAARDRVMLGSVRTLAILPDERRRLAVHEAGHAAAAWWSPESDPVWKVTIIPRGQTLGATHLLPGEERHVMDEGRLRAQLRVMLAGRAAERLLLGSVSNGADDDIARTTRLARAMVGRWGMSEAIGPLDLRESDEHPFLGREIATPRHAADATAAKLDEAVRALVLECEAEATAILTRERPRLERLVARLEAEETLDREAVAACLGDAPRAVLGA